MSPTQSGLDVSFFANAFRDSPLASIVVSAEAKVLFWNGAATRLFGWTAEEATGQPLPFIPPELKDVHCQMHARALDGEGFSGRPITRMRKDGARISLSVSTWPIRGARGEVVAILLLYTDIGEEEREAETLRTRKALADRQLEEFERFYHTAPIGLALLDTEFQFVRVNERLAQIHGMSVEAHSGKTLHEVSPEIAACMEDVCRKVITTGVAVLDQEVHAATFAQPGVPRDWMVSFHPFKHDDGTVLGVTTVISDVTDRKQLMDRLKRQEELLRLVIDGVPGLISYIDRDYRYQLVNREYLTSFKQPASAFDGRPVAEVLGEETFQSVRPLFERVFAGETVVFERHVRYADRERDVRAAYVPDRGGDGTVRGVVVVIQDVTEQKRAEQALRSSEERFRSMVEIAAEGIWIVDPGGRTTFANQRMADILGYPHEVLMSHQFFEFVEPEERDRARLCLERRKEGDVSPREYRFRRGDGATIWLDITASAIRDHTGAVTGVLGMCTDITERKQHEHQARQTQKLESLGILAGGIAHDFNNLLVGIMGNASLAMNTLAPETGARPMLQDVIAASERAAQLTRQLLAYAGRSHGVWETLDVGAMVRELTPLLAASISRTVRLDLDIRDASPVDADPGQLQQVMMNLMINAAESIPERAPGVVTVVVSRRDLTPEDHRDAVIPIQDGATGWVGLSISDTGSGMDSATQARIFDPFFTTKFDGRGLGLSAVLGIVKGHGGTLTLRTAPGKGTTFTVLLPASKGEVGPRVAYTLPEFKPGSGVVLVVDDEAPVRMLAQRTLEAQGYRVLTAENGQAGIEMLATHPEVRAVLLDLAMPVMSGEAAAPVFRAKRPDVPLIFTSGYSESEALDRFGNDIANAFLQKPYRSEALAAKVAEALGAGAGKQGGTL